MDVAMNNLMADLHELVLKHLHTKEIDPWRVVGTLEVFKIAFVQSLETEDVEEMKKFELPVKPTAPPQPPGGD